jgi:plasmid stabilization system protein ParE
MAKEVVLTPIALKDFQNIIDYLNYKWDTSTVNNFIDRFDKILDLLSKDAAIFPFVDRRKQIQKCFLTKHNTLFFIEAEEEVRILTIFDTRQDPEKLTIIF